MNALTRKIGGLAIMTLFTGCAASPGLQPCAGVACPMAVYPTPAQVSADWGNPTVMIMAFLLIVVTFAVIVVIGTGTNLKIKK